jgi:ubiquinone/menaquinone biosynthesis C-methylase UbiE
MNGARFFEWLQAADFYRRLHAEAVAQVPGAGGRWLDVGCGAGLVAGLAAARGFEVTGCDTSAAMVAVAREVTPHARFEQCSLEGLVARGATAEVVSAASLVLLLASPAEGLASLWKLVAPGGRLLVVETTSALRFSSALRHARGRADAGLVLWGLARGGRTVAPVLDAFSPPGLATVARYPLCAGLVGAWLFTRSPTSQEQHP